MKLNDRLGLTAIIACLFGSACAMAQPSKPARECRVENANKLPSDIGGERGICAAIEHAVVAEVAGADYSVDVRILSPNVIAATVTLADGRILPEQKMAISDSQMRKSAIDRFAKSLAVKITEAN